VNPLSQPKYDAILLVAFGGPEQPADVIPFLENVLRGRNVPRERLLAVAEHYYHFGGVSPINQQMRELTGLLEAELSERGPRLPVYWGNRNWRPMLADTVRKMRDDGVRKAAAFVMSAYSSYSGCRQYVEDIARAREAVGEDAPAIDKLRLFYNHAGFIDPVAERVRAALEQAPGAALVYTAHSVPVSMAATSEYEAPPGLAAGLSEPQRAAVAAVAGSGYRRLSTRTPRGGNTRRGGGAHRLHFRSHGGALRSRHGGSWPLW
jgi:ferrochelatase